MIPDIQSHDWFPEPGIDNWLKQEALYSMNYSSYPDGKSEFIPCLECFLWTVMSGYSVSYTTNHNPKVAVYAETLRSRIKIIIH